MGSHFLSNGDAYANAFLADAFLEALMLYSGSGQLAPREVRSFNSVLVFLENAYQGFLHALPASEAERLGREQPAIGRREFTRAFKLTMAIWNSQTWIANHPEFRITGDSVDSELHLYISAVEKLLAGCDEPDAIEGLGRARDFFIELGRMSLSPDSQEDPALATFGVATMSLHLGTTA